MAAATVDIEFLSGYLNLPQPSLTEALDTPTVELVNAVLLAVSAKAREHQELEADKHQVDTELEAAILGSEARTKDLQQTADKALKEANELREKLAAEGTNESKNSYKQLANGIDRNGTRFTRHGASTTQILVIHFIIRSRQPARSHYEPRRCEPRHSIDSSIKECCERFTCTGSPETTPEGPGAKPTSIVVAASSAKCELRSVKR